MPHEHNHENETRQTALEGCLREAYQDLAQKPLPPGLHDKIKGAIAALQANAVAPLSTAQQATLPDQEPQPALIDEAGPQPATEVASIEEPQEVAFSTSFSEGAEASRGARWLTWGPLLALACVLLLPYVNQPQRRAGPMPHVVQPPTKPHGPTRRSPLRMAPRDIAKAGFALEMYHARKTAEGFVARHKTRQGTRLAPGDLVQFSYKRATTPTFVAILSVNQRGDISPYYPLDQSHSVQLSAQGKLPASGSLVLDQYIGPERVFVFVAGKPFSLALARQHLSNAFAKSGGKLSQIALDSDAFQVISFLILKHRRDQSKP